MCAKIYVQWEDIIYEYYLYVRSLWDVKRKRKETLRMTARSVFFESEIDWMRINIRTPSENTREQHDDARPRATLFNDKLLTVLKVISVLIVVTERTTNQQKESWQAVGSERKKKKERKRAGMIMAALRHSLPVLEIYGSCHIDHRFSVLTVEYRNWAYIE